MNNLIDLYNSEPAMVNGALAGLVGAAILAAVAFGIPVSPAQRDAILGLVVAVVAVVPIIAGLSTRSKVTPVPPIAKPVAAVAPVAPVAPPVAPVPPAA